MADDTKKNDAAEAPAEAPAAESADTQAAETLEPGKTVEDVAALKPGMVVRVHQKIKEMTPKGEERERIQIFEGVIIAKKGKDRRSATITVRKISSGVGVERIFPLRSPAIAKIEEVKTLRTRRSKLYFLRTHKKRLKEKK